MPSLDFLLPDENFAMHLDATIAPALAPYRETFYYAGHGGAQLYGEVFTHPNASAVVVISHGFCEYIGKYAETIYNFFQLGYSVAICEHRGHGLSARQTDDLTKVHIDAFSTYTADFNYFTALVSEKFPDQTLLLFGHSMGGCIAACYLEQFPGRYTAAVLSSPMMAITPAGLSPRIALPYAKHLLRTGKPDNIGEKPGFSPTPDFEDSSCVNAERYYAYFEQRLAEPRYQTSNGTVSWLVTSLEAIDKMLAAADTIHAPILLCQAGQDTLVQPSGHDAFIRKANNAVLCRFPRANHEITSADSETRADYWKTVATFLAKHA